MKPDHYVKQAAAVLIDDSITKGLAAETLAKLHQFNDLIRRHSELEQLLLSRRIESDVKMAVLREFPDGMLSEYSLGVIELLINEDLIRSLPLFLKEAEKIRKKKEGISRVNAQLARALPDKELQELKNSIQSSLKKNIEFSYDVNPDILGGMTLRIDNLIIDGSLAHQLNKVRHLLKRTL